MKSTLTGEKMTDLPLTEQEIKEGIEAGTLKGWYLIEHKSNHAPDVGRYYVGEIWKQDSMLLDVGCKFLVAGDQMINSPGKEPD